LPDNPTPQERNEEHFSFLLSFAVCGLLESRLSPSDAGLAFDPEERVLLVATAGPTATFVREPLEPSGVTPELLRKLVLDRAKDGLLFVCNTISSITFERASDPAHTISGYEVKVLPLPSRSPLLAP
jgi:hypothetical protein